MEEENFTISLNDNKILINKGDKKLCIYRDINNNINFIANNQNLVLLFDSFSNNIQERKVAKLLDNLMKRMVGNYFLSGDYDNMTSVLPKDFINLVENKITWYDDEAMDSQLILTYDNRFIKLELTQNPQLKMAPVTEVKVVTTGSVYDYYYVEFEELWNQLVAMSTIMGMDVNRVINSIENQNLERKRKLFNFPWQK